MYNFNDLRPGYRVWYRKDEPNSQWNILPHTPRDTETSGWELVDHYEAMFGNLYEFTVLHCGQQPQGLCVPYT